MTVRDPLPQEERRYRSAVEFKDVDELLLCYKLYTHVLWGTITETLSDSDKAWASEVLKQKEEDRTRELLSDDDWCGDNSCL